MKKTAFFIIFLLFLCNFGFSSQNYYYTSEIEHLFSHCLLAFPEVAFSKNNSMKSSYATDCITPFEFTNILTQLHKNGYCLVDINKCFKEENGKVTKQKVKVPIGKKPLILSFDDVNYDHKKMHRGMVDKIIVDKNGNLATSTMINNEEVVKYDNDVIPILEDFIKKHPDFSFQNAKATLNLTGYDGILGYRTQKSNTTNREEEIIKAKKVVDVLKQKNWTFASHSFGHYHMKKISLRQFEEEVERWRDEVEPLVGHTSIYVYPYGEWEILADGEISSKHLLLEKYGFKLFCGVGMKQFFGYIPFNDNPHKVLFMDRKVADGYTLKNKSFEPLFDASLVYDYENRKLV